MELHEILDLLVEDTEKMNVWINKPQYDKVIRPQVDSTFIDINRIVSRRNLKYKAPRFIDRLIPQIDNGHDETIVLPFSGGKVSLALALRYKNMGKKLHLFYVENSGVSRYDTERNLEEVKKLADMLDMPLHVEITAYRYFEHSLMRNLLILGRALRFAVLSGYSTNILYGTFSTAYLANNDFDTDGKNCVEIISSYEKVMKKFYFNANIIMPMPAYAIVWDELIRHKQYIPYVKCNKAIDKKIWYIAQVDHGILEEENTSLYMKYIKELQKSLESNPGDIHKLWNNYFFYRIEKSKHYGELMKLP